jgi:hypothetical protein
MVSSALLPASGWQAAPNDERVGPPPKIQSSVRLDWAKLSLELLELLQRGRLLRFCRSNGHRQLNGRTAPVVMCHQSFLCRTIQRNPTWLVEVSIG